MWLISTAIHDPTCSSAQSSSVVCVPSKHDQNKAVAAVGALHSGKDEELDNRRIKVLCMTMPMTPRQCLFNNLSMFIILIIWASFGDGVFLLTFDIELFMFVSTVSTVNSTDADKVTYGKSH